MTPGVRHSPEPTRPDQSGESNLGLTSLNPVRFRRAKRRHDGSRVALSVSVVLVFIAVFGPMLAGDASRVEVSNRLQPPVAFGGTWTHPLGTDGLGRDMLAGLVAGARVSLSVGLGAGLVAALIGVPLGLIGGYHGGKLDALISWLIDFQLGFPAMLVILLIAAFVDAGIIPLIFTIGVVTWILFARFARSFAMSARESDFVAAAQLAGSSTSKILRRHLLPNMMAPLLTLFLLQVATAMLAEAALSFLGFGVTRPQASWGIMISEGQQFLQTAWWVVIFPGAMLAVSILVLHDLSRSALGDDPFTGQGL